MMINSVIENIFNNMVYVQTVDLLLKGNSGLKELATVASAPFYINKYPISKKEWYVIMGINDFMESDSLPMCNISWYDCMDFISRLNRYAKACFRLPTKIEWETAASGGKYSHGYKYAGSNNPEEVAWFRSDYNNGIQPIGIKAPNELGLYDMSGNIWEWCSDNDYLDIKVGEKSNFILEYLMNMGKVIKGGSCALGREGVLISHTFVREADFKGNYLGFRLAL